MGRTRKSGKVLGLFLTAVLFVGRSSEVFAAESDELIPKEDEGLISMELPVLPADGKSPFDLIFDPQGLINATNAARYGGRSFEKGATLYFENTEGAYDFSGKSDFLTITNRSAVPVRVKVNAQLEDMGQLTLSQSRSFAGAEDYLYLAIIDDRGNCISFDDGGKAELIYEMAEENEDGFAAYSFGLTGACNPAADWSRLSVRPHITVTWEIEPIAAAEPEESDLLSGEEIDEEDLLLEEGMPEEGEGEEEEPTGEGSTEGTDTPGTVPTGEPDTPGTVPTGEPDTPEAVPTGGPDTPGTVPTGGPDTPGTVPTGGPDTSEAVPTEGPDTPENVPTGGPDTPEAVPTGGPDTPEAVPTGGPDTSEAVSTEGPNISEGASVE